MWTIVPSKSYSIPVIDRITSIQFQQTCVAYCWCLFDLIFVCVSLTLSLNVKPICSQFPISKLQKIWSIQFYSNRHYYLISHASHVRQCCCVYISALFVSKSVKRLNVICIQNDLLTSNLCIVCHVPCFLCTLWVNQNGCAKDVMYVLWAFGGPWSIILILQSRMTTSIVDFQILYHTLEYVKLNNYNDLSIFMMKDVHLFIQSDFIVRSVRPSYKY